MRISTAFRQGCMKSSKARQDNIIPLSRPGAVRRAQREFLPAALEIMETPASPVGRAIAATIILFVLIALGWSIIGRVDIIATASGKIVPTGRTKTIQPLEPGVVAEILVQDGDRVRAGQLLVRLDQTVAQADRQRIGRDLLDAQLDVARLGALRAGVEKGGGPPTGLRPPDDASPDQAAKARAAMLAQAAVQAAKLAALDEQIAQKTAEGDEIAATIDKLEASLPLVQQEAEIRRKAMEFQYGNQIAYVEAQAQFVDQAHEIAVQQRRAAEIPIARAALERQRDQAVAEYAQGILKDLVDAERKVAELTQDAIKADEKAKEQVLCAPVDGAVQQLAVHTIGGVVTAAEPLMMIVPSDSRLEAEVMAPNRDIGFIHPGQSVEIKVDAFDFTRYGLLHGTVMDVSQDAITRDKPQDNVDSTKTRGELADTSEPQGQELVYAVRISLDRTRMNVDGKLVNLTPGMAVTAEIKTGSRRVISYLLSPLLRYRHESLRER
jgi:hemolysin D